MTSIFCATQGSQTGKKMNCEKSTMATNKALFQAAMAAPPTAGAATGATVQMSRSVHVGNLAATVTPDVLRTIFGCLGTIVDLRVGTNGKYCFIDFDAEAAAQAAVDLNGTGARAPAPARRAPTRARARALSARARASFADIGGQALRVEMAKTPKLSQSAQPKATPAMPMMGMMQVRAPLGVCTVCSERARAHPPTPSPWSWV